MVELLAAVPSVVYGLWGVFALVPWLRSTIEPALGKAFGFLPFFQGPHQGFGLLAGGIILAIMILPTVSSVSREVLRAVPLSLREGALALGRDALGDGADGGLALRRARASSAPSSSASAAPSARRWPITMVIGNRADMSISLLRAGATRWRA